MSIELIPAEEKHIEQLSRICHLAFNTLHERHRVHPDVPTEEVGGLIIGSVLKRPDYVGRVAVVNGRVVGSNFLLLADDVCGVGRVLMQWAIDEARKRRGERARVRLFQEAINTTSLSLYTSLGFCWRDSAAMMNPAPAPSDDASVRPITMDDLKHVERLSTRHYGASRANDAARLIEMEFSGFVREREGRVVGYQIATLFGHSSAETDEDLLALAGQTARRLPESISVIIVPMSQDSLFRRALGLGFRVAKVLNYMSLEAFEAPPGPTLPSIQC